MKICPHCQNQIPDEKNNIYCPFCNHITDEQVLLRLKIEKRLRMLKEENKKTVKKGKEEPVKLKKRYDDDDYHIVRVSDDKIHDLFEILSIIILAFIIAAIFFF